MATRRTVSTKQIGNAAYRKRRSSNNSKKVVNGKLTQQSAATATISKVHQVISPDRGTIPSTPAGLSTDILHALGISQASKSERRKKSFSIIKTQKSNMIVKNPAILDIYTFKKLPRLPVPANSIFKNQNDAFFAASADSKLSRAQRQKMEKYLTPNPTDFTNIVISVLNQATRPDTHALRALHVKGKN